MFSIKYVFRDLIFFIYPLEEGNLKCTFSLLHLPVNGLDRKVEKCKVLTSISP